MYKKSITSKDLDGNTITDDYWFNLTKAEVFELEFDAEGGSFQKMFEEIIEKNDKSKIISTFKLVIRKAFGIREGEENRRFRKSEEISDAFVQSDAYSELFVELMTVPEAAAQFIVAVIPELPEGTVFPGTEKPVETLDVPVLNSLTVVKPPADGIIANPDPIGGVDLSSMNADELRKMFDAWREKQ